MSDQAAPGTPCPACGMPLDAPTTTAATSDSETLEAIWKRTVPSDASPSETLRGAGTPARTAAKLSIRPYAIASPRAHPTGDVPPAYELLDVLGEGGMGVVYAARQTSMDRTIALKMIRPESAGSEARRKRFLSEAAITGDLEHPNIVPVYELGTGQDGRLFYAMRRVGGSPWSRDLAVRTLAENLRILLDVADAVAFAHWRRVIHRDLKPDNVLLGDYGEVLLADWGLAAALGPDGTLAGIGRPQCFGGTPSYMAPEMAAGQPERTGPASDIYLLGAILYEIVTGHAPHEGKTAHDCLRAAADNVLRPTDRQGELIDVARTALATDPADRYEDVQAFQAAVRQYQEHAESIALAEQARGDLDRAKETRTYEDFTRARFVFEQALRLWADNRRAKDGIRDARMDHASIALGAGDLDLARSVLEAGELAETPLMAKVLAAQKRRATRQRRGRWMATAAVALAATVLALVGYFVYDWYRQWGDWLVVYEQDFTHPGATADGLIVYTRDLRGTASLPKPSPDGIGAGHGGRWLWLKNIRVRGDVRVVVQMHLSTWDPLEICINSRREPIFAANGWGLPPGYCCKIDMSGGRNTLTLWAAEQQRYVDTTICAPMPIRGGQDVELAFVRHDGRVFVTVNGIEALGEAYPLPLRGQGLDGIGLRFISANTKIRSLRVYRLRLPERASPLVAADSLVRHDRLGEAVAEYRQIAQDFDGTRTGEDALMRAYLCALRLADSDPPAETIREAFDRRYPASRHGSAILEARAVALWHAGRFDEAVRLLDATARANPQTLVTRKFLASRRESLGEATARKLLRFVARTPTNGMLDIEGLGLTDLEPLRGLELVELRCGSNRLTSLEPLRGMALRNLQCHDNRLTRIEPLRDMPLKRLDLSDNRIDDLSALKGTPLDILDVSGNRIESLEPLRGMALSSLHCADNRIRSLEPLRNMPLHILWCGLNPIESLEPIRHLPLRELDIPQIGLKSLQPLAGMKLRTLRCARNSIEDLEPLRGMCLFTLNIDENRVESLRPLAGMHLSRLDCQGNQIADLGPLARMPLITLRVRSNRVRDLRPLVKMCLRTVDIADNPVSDLRPLNMMPLDVLFCDNTRLTDLGPLLTGPPKQTFSFACDTLPDTELLRARALWSRRPELARLARAVDVILTVRNRDLWLLRQMAHPFRGHLYLHVPASLSWNQAKNLCEQLGGHLVTITDAPEYAHVLSLLPVHISAWIGLSRTDGVARWVTDEPVRFARYYPHPVQSWNARADGHFTFHLESFSGWIPHQKETCFSFLIEWDSPKSASPPTTRPAK